MMFIRHLYHRSQPLCRLTSTLMLVTMGCACALAGDAEAPTLASDAKSQAVVMRKPTLFRQGWIDLDKDDKRSPYEDSTVEKELRIKDLMSRMTVKEKIGQCWQRPMSAKDATSDGNLVAAGKVGSFLGVDAAGPGLRNELQRRSVEDSRLGIPLVFGYDTIHGLRTIFPIPLAQSCAWDPTLNERINAVAAAESKAVGIDWTFAPMVDIARDPRWGRIAEGNGEDPYLGSLLAAGGVRGFQGTDAAKSNRVAACLKHYVGYGAAEGGRDYNSTEIGLHTLRNVYLPPFKAGVEAGALSIMSAFNMLNGVPASGNRFTLNDILRSEWGFTGLMVSDWDSVKEMIGNGYAKDGADAARIGLNAGVDMEMTSDTYVRNFEKLLSDGAISQATLDEAVRRILRFKLNCGVFDRPYAEPQQNAQMRPASLALAREAVARSAVLIKNQQSALPLVSGKRIALIGPYAESRDLLGCWKGVGLDEDAVTLAEGLKAQVGAGQLTVVSGCDLLGNNASHFPAALAAAAAADVVVLAVGEPSAWSGEGNCRQSLSLPGVQGQLASQIAKLGKPMVTVLFCGRPLAIPELLEQSSALLIAWHPGVQAGHGLADILTGAVEPTGRLTTSWPVSVGQVPVYYNSLPIARGHVGRCSSNYVDGNWEPLLRFGSGMGYTTFQLSPVVLDQAKVPLSGTVTVTTQLRNTGTRRGTTVVQCYVRDHAALGGPRPIRELRDFRHVTLDPGATETVTFKLNRERLTYWLPDGTTALEAGKFSVWVGQDCITKNGAEFTLTDK